MTECRQCKFTGLSRSNSRGVLENVLFVLGAEILRCPNCQSRQAQLGPLALPLRPAEGSKDNSALWLMSTAILGGLLICVGIALWVLRRFHRWPY